MKIFLLMLSGLSLYLLGSGLGLLGLVIYRRIIKGRVPAVDGGDPREHSLSGQQPPDQLR